MRAFAFSTNFNFHLKTIPFVLYPSKGKLIGISPATTLPIFFFLPPIYYYLRFVCKSSLWSSSLDLYWYSFSLPFTFSPLPFPSLHLLSWQSLSLSSFPPFFQNISVDRERETPTPNVSPPSPPPSPPPLFIWMKSKVKNGIELLRRLTFNLKPTLIL